MNTGAYLKRINYTGPVKATAEAISQLQYTHLLHVPFENLDIQNHVKIDLGNLFDKIVIRKRGGFCYELNGLFYELLKAIGFTVKMVSARVYDGKGGYTPEYDHMALILKTKDNKYLVDVGFGEFSFYPIKIELNKETIDPRGIFKIENVEGKYLVSKKKNADEMYITEYIFSEKERQLEEFYGMCNYHETSDESHFMQKRICSLATKNGRITLTGNTLKITEGEEVKETQLNNEQEIEQALWDYFGIEL